MTDTAITPARTNQYNRFKTLVKSENVQERFQQLLDKRASEFLGSLLSLVTADDNLLACDPATIFAAAAKAAILQLPIAKELGFAWIIPFGKEATFVIGYKGLIQLAIRTTQYEDINVGLLYEGERAIVDRLSGNVTGFEGDRTGDEVTGYFAYFKLKNGFKKSVYMSQDEVTTHAKKFSKSYNFKNGAWNTNPHEMGKKTVLRLLLSKWGLLSIEMQDSDVREVPAVGEDPRLTMPKFDDLTGEVLDAEFNEPPAPDPEPEQESTPDLTAQVIAAAIEAQLTENEHSGKNALKLAKVEFATVEDGVAWFKRYRAWREMDAKPKSAAEYADAGEMPK